LTLSQVRRSLEHLGCESSPSPEIDERLEELTTSLREIAWPQLLRILPAARLAGVSSEVVKGYEDALAVMDRALVTGEPGQLEENDVSRREALEAIQDLSRFREQMLQEQMAYFHCDPTEVLSRMVEAASSGVRDLGVDLAPLSARLGPGVRAFIRATDLRTVIEDLVVNACRAVRECEKKQVGVTLDTAGDRVVIDVTDTGSGIPPELKNRIFERGFSTREGKGGFGLYQAAEILDRFGGRIFVACTEEGAGTTMRVELLPV
jgi:signal transduction histidine kinase